jgi:DNA-binding NarL/FixJ family response regulator
MDNCIFLCPNCHRLVTMEIISISPASVAVPPKPTGRYGKKGEENSNAKLTADKVREIKQLLREGCSQYAVAAKFGVSRGAIGSIHRGANWAYID